MSYEAVVDWMFNLERFGIKLGLENMRDFSDRIGNPHKDFRSIHVTGTNGKGSVCNFAANMLREHGLKVGLYTSPHLVDFRERISINGRMISERDVVSLAEELRPEMEEMAEDGKEKQLTFFEFTTGLAFKYFSQKKVDYVVAEVGMGGRLDATNIIDPDITVITRIGIEHTDYLGKSLHEIAFEKAGIIKPGRAVVTCERERETLDFFQGVCQERKCDLRRIGADFDIHVTRQTLEGTTFDYQGTQQLNGLETRLIGAFQAENAGAAIAAVEGLKVNGVYVSEEEIRKGILESRWPGRLDIVSRDPLIIFDGSHNPDGVRMTVGTLSSLGASPLTFVLACMKDKDAKEIVRSLAKDSALIISTEVDNKRALPAEELDRIVKQEFDGPAEIAKDSSSAIESAVRQVRGKGICVIGSLYLAGEAIKWRRLNRHPPCAEAHKI
jgi:dihydrofolate synthase/folylpolyglutamate synthase